jgi:hypothetical protein
MIDILTHWVSLSLLSTTMIALYLVTAERYPQSAMSLLFWRGLGCGLLLIPIIFFIDAPTNIYFYLILIFNSIVALVGDLCVINAARKYGSGLTSRTLPLTVFLTFLFWLMVHPDTITYYITHPIIGGGISLSLIGCVYFSFKLRSCEVSMQAYKMVMPAIIIYSLCNITAKYALDMVDATEGAFYYTFVQGWIMAAIVYGYLQVKKDKERLGQLFNNTALRFGFVLSCAMVGMLLLRNYAYIAAPNVSYPNAIQLLAPLWLLLWYKLSGKREDNIDVKTGMAILACAIILILFTANSMK